MTIIAHQRPKPGALFNKAQILYAYLSTIMYNKYTNKYITSRRRYSRSRAADSLWGEGNVEDQRAPCGLFLLVLCFEGIIERLIQIRNVLQCKPPAIAQEEFDDLPPHECEHLYLNGSFELYCLHSGKLARTIGDSEFRA